MFLILLAVAPTIGEGQTPPQDSPYVPTGYDLVHSDEFDGPTLDTTKWHSSFLPHWSDDAHFPYAQARYVIEGGILKLQTRLSESSASHWWSPWDPNIKSGVMTGEFSGAAGTQVGLHRFSYCRLNVLGNCVVWSQFANQSDRLAVTRFGYFELRAKACPVAGCTWWMVGFEENPQHSGEIDVLELNHGRPPSWQNKCAHFGVHKWDDPYLFEEAHLYSETCDQFHEWHVYGLLWLPDRVTLFMDGQEVRTIHQSPQYEMVTILDVSNGAGHPTLPTGVRNQFEIDYFRIYKDRRIDNVQASMANGEPGWGNVPERAVDSDLFTYAQAYTEKWDLLANLSILHAVHKIVVRPSWANWAKDYVLRVVREPGAATTIATVAGATNESREFVFDPPVVARSIRMNVSQENASGDFAHAVEEFEVYGEPNLAQTAVASMLNSEPGWGHLASHAVDGDRATYAQATTENWGLQVVLEAESFIERIVYTPSAVNWARDYAIKVRTEGGTWQTVRTVLNADGTVRTHVFDPPVWARRVRLVVASENTTGDYGHGVDEFEIYGMRPRMLQ
jgi:hypothetical protein